jgi:hypothetical protein
MHLDRRADHGVCQWVSFFSALCLGVSVVHRSFSSRPLPGRARCNRGTDLRSHIRVLGSLLGFGNALREFLSTMPLPHPLSSSLFL